MNKKQLKVLEEINSSGGAYVSLGSGKVCKDIGYIHSEKDLKSQIAAYAAKVGATRIHVMTGKNIMDCGYGPDAYFSVEISIK